MPLRNRNRNTIPNFRKVGGEAPFSFGNALKFDGVNDFVSFTPLSFTSNFTINFWFNPSQDGSQNYGLFGTGVTSDNQSIWVRPNSFFRVRLGANLYTVNTTFLANTWYFITVTRNSSDVTVFRNGASLGTQTVNTDTIIFNGFGYGEQLASNSIIYFDGKMDEISLYDNVVFNLQNHIDLYNGGSGNYANKIISNPYSYYRLNESGAATTTTDSSGNGNDGTLNNFSRPPEYWVAH